MEQMHDIPNLALPIAKSIRIALNDLSLVRKKQVLAMTEDEFIEYRVDVYLKELEIAMQSESYSNAGAEEIARHEAMGDLLNDDE
jgi:hypothetical protein